MHICSHKASRDSLRRRSHIWEFWLGRPMNDLWSTEPEGPRAVSFTASTWQAAENRSVWRLLRAERTLRRSHAKSTVWLFQAVQTIPTSGASRLAANLDRC